MEHTEVREPKKNTVQNDACGTSALAAGLFGYSIYNGQMCSFKKTEGYLRDMEQMPNFAPPTTSSFVANYLESNIGKTHSSS